MSRYISGLRLDIQDEIILLSPNTVEYAYQFALKLEEKLTRRQSNHGMRQGIVKGRGKHVGEDIFSSRKEETDSSNQQRQSFRGSDSRRGIPHLRGRGIGREPSNVLSAVNLDIYH